MGYAWRVALSGVTPWLTEKVEHEHDSANRCGGLGFVLRHIGTENMFESLGT